MPYQFWRANIKRNVTRDSINPEIDETRSRYPIEPLSNDGWYNYGASQVYTALISAVPSTKVFIGKHLIVDNRIVGNQFYFYDASGANVSATMFGLHVGQSTANFIDLPSLPFLHGVYVSNLDSQVSLRITGILVTSGE